MVKDIKIQDVKQTISSNEYVSNIGDTVGKVKNIVLEAKILDINKIKFEKGIFTVLKIKDNSGVIPAILIGNNDDKFKKVIENIDVNDTYLFKGDINILEKPDDEELDLIFYNNSETINIGDIYFIIRELQKIN